LKHEDGLERMDLNAGLTTKWIFTDYSG